MKRVLDVFLALAALAALGLPMLIIALVVRLTSPGTALYWSDRVGRGGRLFRMPKFRTMRTDTPALATHLMTDPGRYLTSVGGFLRRSSLDELPQLYCILRGDMSFVGPRPALFNQTDLISLRAASGVEGLHPGLTGWAQVNGRDDLDVPDKAAFDAEYLAKRSFLFDLRILLMTFRRVFTSAGVRH